MKAKNILLLFILPLVLSACTEDIMDEVNRELNNTTEMGLDKLIPDILLKSAFESTATDMAWYASVYIEHSTGTWNQMNNADIRAAQEAGTNLNNNWNGLYDVMNICRHVMDRTEVGAEDEGSDLARGIAQVMMAYNLAIATDGWGEIPYTEPTCSRPMRTNRSSIPMWMNFWIRPSAPWEAQARDSARI